LGCEKCNTYNVFAADSAGNMIKNCPILKCKEKSDCCTRNFLAPDCRPFKINVEHDAEGISSTDGM
jgi:hypothetical protein